MADTGSIEDKLQALKQRYQASFPDKLADLLAARQLLESGDGQKGLQQLRHHGHKLAGSGASYGFPELSAQARKLEYAAIAALDSQSTDYAVLFNEYDGLAAFLKG